MDNKNNACKQYVIISLIKTRKYQFKSKRSEINVHCIVVIFLIVVDY